MNDAGNAQQDVSRDSQGSGGEDGGGSDRGTSGVRPRKVNWRRMLVWIVIIYVIYLAGVRYLFRSVIFPRDAVTSMGAGAAKQIRQLEQLSLQTSQGAVDLWFVPGDGVSPQQPGPAVIYAHGNAELIEDQTSIISRYRAMGISVMLPEYRGYGMSAGSPSQAAITEDFVAAYDLLVKRAEVDPQRIIIHGRSIGSGVACALARERKPAALVLVSPLFGITRFTNRMLVPSVLVPDRFDNARVVSELAAPILIFHGSRDDVIPVTHGRDLAALSPGARFVEYDCQHNDFPMESQQFWADLSAFFEQNRVISRNRCMWPSRRGIRRE